MENSICNTNSESKHDIFRKRLKEEYKRKHLTSVVLADKIGYSVAAVNGWLKTSGRFPNYNTLVQLSELFDCDVAYLMGEIDCRHISTQRIVDLTGLSPKSAEKLEHGNNTMLDAIISNNNYEMLMARTWQYTHSQYTGEVSVNDESGLDVGKVADGLSARDILKSSAADMFSRMLDSIYDSNSIEMRNIRKATQLKDDENNFTNMLRVVHKFHEIAEMDSSTKDKLLSVIKEYLSKFQTEEMSLWKQTTPETIYDNYVIFAQKAQIDLEEKSR